MHLFSVSGIVFDMKSKIKLSDMMVGLKKSIANENSKKKLRTMEGKEHIAFEVYKLTCQLLVEDGSPESIFCLCFLTLQ